MEAGAWSASSATLKIWRMKAWEEERGLANVPLLWWAAGSAQLCCRPSNTLHHCTVCLLLPSGVPPHLPILVLDKPATGFYSVLAPVLCKPNTEIKSVDGVSRWQQGGSSDLCWLWPPSHDTGSYLTGETNTDPSIWDQPRTYWNVTKGRNIVMITLPMHTGKFKTIKYLWTQIWPFFQDIWRNTLFKVTVKMARKVLEHLKLLPHKINYPVPVPCVTAG